MTKRGLLRAGLWAAVFVVSFMVAGLGVALYFVHKFNPSPPRNDFAIPANALQAQQQDIEQFSRLLAMDRSFSPAARAAADRSIAALRAASVPLDRATFRVALMRIATLADNGHTSIDDYDDDRPNCVGIRVFSFDDGLYVLRAKATYADLLGARVERIDGRTTGDVLAALGQLHGGAPGWRRMNAVLYVQSPEILFGAALGSSPDHTVWTFHLADGRETTRTLTAEACGGGEPYALMTRWLSPQRMKGEPAAWRSLFLTDAGLAPSLREFNAPFRRFRVDRSCTLFMQLKAISDVGNYSIRDFLAATADEMAAHPPCNVILDLRFNTGGDYTKAARFASQLPTLVPSGGRIFILTGPQTVSAAITTAGFVKQAAGSRAVILGETVGDRLAFYGEGNTGCLPHARLCVHYATGMHDYGHRCGDWDKCFWLNWLFPVQVRSLVPDETIRMRFSDYGAQRDPVFERAAALAADWSQPPGGRVPAHSR